MFYNCLSTVPCGPWRPTEDSRNTEGDVIRLKALPFIVYLFLGIEGSGRIPEPISRPLLSFINNSFFKQAITKPVGNLLSSASISLITAPFGPCNHCITVVLLLPSASY
jgi:hypothetical protein